jgi:D-alanyl-D-alanine carboxypeptidase
VNADLLAARVGATRIAALTVGVSHRGQRQVASGGHVPSDGRSAYRIASLTKPFTSAATVLALTARGIPLTTPAIELLPALAPDWRADRAITVEQLLAQVAGLRESVDSTVLAPLGDGDDVLLTAARLVVGAGSERAPGERWSYYNGNYFLIGAILAAVTSASYEDALSRTLLAPWGLELTGLTPYGKKMAGHDRGRALPDDPYPRPRRPSGGLWSCVTDLLSFAERLLADAALLAETGRARTRPDDPMRYGLGWALGPSGQMYLNGRLPGYRTAMLVVPGQGYASVALAAEQDALPEIARLLSDLQRPLTGDDLARAIDAFAA